MEPNWEHIKREIQGKKAPLSNIAWQQMDALLDAKKAPAKKGFVWWIAALVLLFLALPTIWLVQKNNVPEMPQTEIKNIKSIIKTEQQTPSESEENAVNPELEKIKKETIKAFPDVIKEKEKLKSPRAATSISAETSKTPKRNSAQKVDEAQNENAFEIASKNVNHSEEPSTEENTPTFTEAGINDTTSEKSNVAFETQSNDTTVTNFPEQGKTKSNKKGTWELKLYAGPTFNAPNISYNSAANFTHKEYNSVTNNSVNAGWGMDAGAELSYYILPHFKLNSGIGYRNIVTQNSMNYAVDEIPVIDSASGQILGYITLPNAAQYASSSKNSFTYVGVPLSLFAEFDLGNRFSLTTEFVNTVSFLLSQSSEEINPQSLELQESPADLFNHVLFNYQLRLGLRYRLNNNFSLALEPAYRGSYNNMYNSNYISWKPSDFSLNAAIIIHLHKK